MRSCYYTFMLLSVFCLQQITELKAQETQPTNVNLYPLTVGYSDANSVKDVLKYRLPKWSYSSGVLNINAGYNDQDLEYGGYYYVYDDRYMFGSIKTEDYDIVDGALNFTYTNVSYSDNAILSYYVGLNAIYRSKDSDSGTRDLNYDSSYRNNYDTQYYSLNVGIANDQYVSNNIFYTTAVDASILSDNKSEDVVQSVTEITRYYNGGEDILDSPLDVEENLYDYKGDYQNWTYNIRPTVGFGFGRIRNVTPLFRAIRLNNRLQTLGYNSLTNNDIQDLAAKLTTREGFSALFDRPTKSHLNQIYNAEYFKDKNLQAYDILYLNEEYDNTMATRFEGYRLSYKFRYALNYKDYDNKHDGLHESRLTKYENSSDYYSGVYTSKDEETTPMDYHDKFSEKTVDYIHSLKMEYYKNLNLKWMVGTQARYDYIINEFTEKEGGDKHKDRMTSKIWDVNAFVLYEMTDRLTTRLEGGYARDVGRSTLKPIYFKLSANYFIENFMVLQPHMKWANVKGDYSYYRNRLPKSGSDFEFGITAKIYLGRSLKF